MKKSLFAVSLLLCPLAVAQGTFGGPGVLSRGAGVGQRSGQDVDLKYFANATGTYDTGLTPYAVTNEGTLVRPGGLYGMEVGLGGYGRHGWRRSALGVDYSGNFRHYASASNYDGANQSLGISYTYQKSRKLTFDFNGGAGTQSFGTAVGVTADTDAILGANSLLFDNRTSYYQTAMTTRYALSSRTSISMGGDYYSIHRKSSALVGVNGYSLQGSLYHQFSRSTTVGVSFQHSHFDFPRAFGESDVNSYYGTLAHAFGRNWNVSLNGGIFRSAVQGVQSTALDPTIAALLGISSISTIFYRENTLPMGGVSVTRRFRKSSLGGSYTRTVTSGNGVYLTSSQEAYGGSYSYTGLRRIGLSINGGITRLGSLGKDLVPYSQRYASANFSYNLGKGLNFATSYSRRFQDIQALTFQQNSSRVSVSIYFSPGTIPVSFH